LGVVACVVLTVTPMVRRALAGWPPPLPLLAVLVAMPVVSLLLVHDLDGRVTNRALRILLLLLGVLDLVIPFALLIVS